MLWACAPAHAKAKAEAVRQASSRCLANGGAHHESLVDAWQVCRTEAAMRRLMWADGIGLHFIPQNAKKLTNAHGSDRRLRFFEGRLNTSDALTAWPFLSDG